MKRVNLESSAVLAGLSRSVGEIKDDMQDNLRALKSAFDSACERWQDKNAQACKNALDSHSAAMRSAFERLSDFEVALNRLSELASLYENIE